MPVQGRNFELAKNPNPIRMAPKPPQLDHDMTEATFSRRTLLVAGLCGLALPQAARAATSDPWAPRRLAGWEIAPLVTLRDRLATTFRQEGIEVEFVKDNTRVRMPEGVLFADARGRLSERGVQILIVLAEELLRVPKVRAEIVGHFHAADSSWRSAIESGRRAFAVESALISRGVPRERLLATGLGDRFRILGHPELDRRIDVAIRPL
ncbi:OmpA family protein [Cereibacter sphaeroides]|uniref:OmpA family protein n=1 Tax=Cereibacter sphaeroides TaxID=1063 RepID=UPI001F1B3D99|nr:OmpA family protein [Cereibacter sphaeroides]MCE6959565.1 OmpA family protein [Cereibacter sphaeroides]MCE6974575.1 OmpA family protein [Cereibacter sphaeroides]